MLYFLFTEKKNFISRGGVMKMVKKQMYISKYNLMGKAGCVHDHHTKKLKSIKAIMHASTPSYSFFPAVLVSPSAAILVNLISSILIPKEGSFPFLYTC